LICLRLQNTSNEDKDELSVDNAIINYLYKKNIVDQTEKLVFARISSKTQLSIRLVEIGISRLCTKNLIRKIFFQGKIGFELTPKKILEIETLAKAETDRITRQLQESIQKEQKTKIRLDAVKKVRLIEEKWRSNRLPDRQQMDATELEVNKFLAETEALQTNQPFCNINPQTYEKEFTAYKLLTEKLIDQNSKLTRTVNNYSKIKDHLILLLADICTVGKNIAKYEALAEAEAQVDQLKTDLTSLKSIQHQLESFDKSQLLRFEELKSKLAANYQKLEILRKPTHEFVAIRREITIEKASRYQDPEGIIRHDRKTSASPLEEKCGKCGLKRASTPFDIG
jgi:hypothetical protein